MNTKVLLAALVAFVVLFLSGWVIFGMLLMEYMKDAMVNPGALKAEMNLPLIAAGNLVFGFFYAWLANSTGSTTLMRGLLNGFIVGALICLGIDLTITAQMDMYKESTTIAVDVLANGVWGALGMGSAALILGMGKKEA
jgi:uncharacterized membrane protein SpoIIM required for sporulation